MVRPALAPLPAVCGPAHVPPLRPAHSPPPPHFPNTAAPIIGPSRTARAPLLSPSLRNRGVVRLKLAPNEGKVNATGECLCVRNTKTNASLPTVCTKVKTIPETCPPAELDCLRSPTARSSYPSRRVGDSQPHAPSAHRIALIGAHRQRGMRGAFLQPRSLVNELTVSNAVFARRRAE